MAAPPCSVNNGEMEHTLVLVRHAHAEPYADGGDHARPLSSRGHEQARMLGQRLAQILPTCDVAVYSDARRTQETAEHLLRACPAEVAWADRSLYTAYPKDILTLISQINDARTLVIIGHEPTISEVGSLLAIDSHAISRGVPTATALVLRHNAEWSTLHDQQCELEVLYQG